MHAISEAAASCNVITPVAYVCRFVRLVPR